MDDPEFDDFLRDARKMPRPKLKAEARRLLAKSRAGSDQEWARMESRVDDLMRVARDGPEQTDDTLVRECVALVFGEVAARFAARTLEGM